MAYDRDKQADPAWAPLFEGYKPVAKWLAERKPDVLVFFYNDHLTSFFFDLYPTFALGASPVFEIADEGVGVRKLPPIKGHPKLAAHLADALVNDEFDIAVFQDRPLDHGVNSPLTLLWPHEPDWPAALVPIQVNVLQYPLPTAMRCYKLGQSIRRASSRFPTTSTSSIVGTGGLSHQIHGERAGFNNTEWDMKFLELIEKDPDAAGEDEARRLHPPGRRRERGSDHVARHARGAFPRGEEDAPELLSRHQHRDDGGALRGTETHLNPQLEGLSPSWTGRIPST